MNDAALEAAVKYGIDPDSLAPLVGNSASSVFKGTKQGRSLVLKVSQSPLLSYESYNESISYLDKLTNQMNGTIKFPIIERSNGGRLLEIVCEDHDPHFAFAQEFIEATNVCDQINGAHFTISNPDIGGEIYDLMGRALGTMHEYSKRYPLWRSETDSQSPYFPGDRASEPGEGKATGFYNGFEYYVSELEDDPDLVTYYRNLKKRAMSMEPRRETYGIIHYDFSLSNVMYDGTTLSVIDHLACYGHFIWDVATACSFASSFHDGTSHDVKRYLWQRFIDLYNEQTNFDEEQKKWILLVLEVQRALFYSVNVRRKKMILPALTVT